ncbi:hypothetical protein [Methylotuvimicrobium buryatense]|uniref:hypothetical protein n=1 Tax=Methylotuvimicrobium buryatense TaxID=95641 RepID=UPI00034D0C2C|nr:hypothetical protein [Methylotuvimicrobium buryatense]
MLLIALFSAWALFPSGKPEVRTVTGTVIEVNQGESQSWKTGSRVSLVTARIRVGDIEPRVMITGQLPVVGSEIELVEETYPDGQVRYRLRR